MKILPNFGDNINNMSHLLHVLQILFDPFYSPCLTPLPRGCNPEPCPSRWNTMLSAPKHTGHTRTRLNAEKFEEERDRAKIDRAQA